MTSELTREKAQWLHDACEEAAAAGIKLTMNPNELLMFTSYALAKMDSEPVAWTWHYREKWHVTNDEERARNLAWDGVKVESLYRHAQPAPVVPEDVRQALSQMDDEIIAELDAEESACRAAMLQSGNSPVIGVDLASGPDRTVEVRYVAPPGYVMVPKEPTENMVIDGFESAPDRFFSDPDVWDAYEAMSGCQQAAHRARLCWAAMIAAAPKQENI